jgi:hypothetical protein
MSGATRLAGAMGDGGGAKRTGDLGSRKSSFFGVRHLVAGAHAEHRLMRPLAEMKSAFPM